MKLIAFIEKPSVGYPVSIGIFLVGIACILLGFLAFGCIDGGFGLGLMMQVGQANGHYPIPPEGKRGELPVVVRAGIARGLTCFGLLAVVISLVFLGKFLVLHYFW